MDNLLENPYEEFAINNRLEKLQRFSGTVCLEFELLLAV
jgi:hypothetical protein